MQCTTKSGQELAVTLDFDAVCEYEAKNPDWSIIQEVRRFGKTMRFTTLNTLVGLTTYQGDWKDWTKDGLTISDLTDVITEGLNELGFGSEEEPSDQ